MLNFKNCLCKGGSQEKGFVALLITMMVLMFMTSVAMSMSSLIFYRQKMATNDTKSTQSYYAAEAGIEDALIRLTNNHQMSALSYSLNVGNATANVVIPSIIGGSRVITSQGSYGNIIRNIQAVYRVDTKGVSFHYGAQVGAGGLQMANGSEVKGNVFSNGNITGPGTIDNNVIVAGNGHSIKDVHVKGNTLAYSCLSPANIDGNLTYVTGGSHTCTVHGTTQVQSQEIGAQPMPISQSQIDNWKTEAINGGVTNGNVTIANGQTISMGPKKITGNLTINNNATLNLTGTVYVVGTITLNNNATIRLDNSYGSLGGVIMSDGIISINNNVTLKGTGQTGSYLLVLSNSTEDQAITVNNNTNGAIFYTSAGGIQLTNNATIQELTGYKVIMENNVVIQYDSGLENVFFSDGPSGSWKVTSWQPQ